MTAHPADPGEIDLEPLPQILEIRLFFLVRLGTDGEPIFFQKKNNLS